MSVRLAIPCLVLLIVGRVCAQSAPASSNHPWHSSDEQKIEELARYHPQPGWGVDSGRFYSLALILRLASSLGFLSDQPAGVCDPDVARGGKGPRGWGSGRTVRDVACF
jgi:hypothetical protein